MDLAFVVAMNLMPKRPKRPRDPAQLAKLMIDIASGKVEDRSSAGKKRAAKYGHKSLSVRPTAEELRLSERGQFLALPSPLRR